ncbi:UNVERIFIED_CONTAM: YggT family protein [Acetivibrio alkalicellulosi]
MSELTVTVLRAADLFLFIIVITILIRAISSWMPIPKENMIFKLINQITEPLLSPIRKLIKASSFGDGMRVDLSPLIVVVVITIIRNILRSII